MANRRFKCPKCGYKIRPAQVRREGKRYLRCPSCDEKLSISRAYHRFLNLGGLLLATAVPLVLHIRNILGFVAVTAVAWLPATLLFARVMKAVYPPRLTSCKQRLSGHEYVQFATCVVPKEKSGVLQAFFQAIKDHDWTKLQEFQNWNPLGDDVGAYAVRCSNHDFSVVVIKTHFELFQGSRLLFCETLLAEQGEKLLAAFPLLQWHSF